MSAVRILRLDGSDDPRLPGDAWDALLRRGATDEFFLTREWQRAWWETFARGELLLLAAEHGDNIAALAPFFTEAGMVYFVGSGGSDYLDFIGDTAVPGVLEALLDHARRAVPGFIGFVFYHLPESSANTARLREAAATLGLMLFEEGELPAPRLDLRGQPEAARAAANKKSLVRHEKFFARDGSLRVTHARDAEEILSHLDAFFAQHETRWAGTPSPSLFRDAAQRRFYRRLTELASAGGALRFTRVEWQGRPVAFHFGFCHRGSFIWYKPTFDVTLAKHSPGEVLLRQLLLAADAEGAHTFDFGLGDEAFKARFATGVRRVRNWGLYDPTALKSSNGTRTTHHAP
jgi:CelD/BcsL family acetyltransferase involved in cellulose biosynthesis